MDERRLGRLTATGVIIALVGGIVAIILGEAGWTSLGVVLVILGLIGLMPALRYTVLLGTAADRSA